MDERTSTRKTQFRRRKAKWVAAIGAAAILGMGSLCGFALGSFTTAGSSKYYEYVQPGSGVADWDAAARARSGAWEVSDDADSSFVFASAGD